MRLFGLTIERTKAPTGLQTPDSRGGWWPIVREGFTGAWQQNVETPLTDVLQHPTVFACITLIASDAKKCRWGLAIQEQNDVWVPAENPAFTPVLRAPNSYQDPGQLREQWLISKLENGNTYVLKGRDQRGVVDALYVLDPWRVKPLVAPDGSVFYELQQDLLGQTPNVVVPAREIIHDRFNCFYHPLVGISPLYAAGIPSILGLRIEQNSAQFFGNGSIPGGILTVPGALSQEKATTLKTTWDANYGGANRGAVAVLADGMKFETIGQPADKSQLNEQWLMASQAIAICFHVPWFLVGGPMPPYNNVQTLTVQYLTQCLQVLFTSMENCLDTGLGLTDKINGTQYGVQFNIQDLLIMDTLTQTDVLAKQVSAGLLKPNEGRAALNLLPVDGGDTPYLQEQNFSLAALAERDAMGPQPPVAMPPTPPDVTPQDQPPDQTPQDVQAMADVAFRKELKAA